MKVTTEIPNDVVEKAIESGLNMGHVAREALLIELFRRKVIEHATLRETLGLPLLDVDAILKERGIPLGEATREEQIERNQSTIRFIEEISRMDVPADEPSWEKVKAGIARAISEETEP
jgi:predicted HTH domain antitoxin